VVHLPAATPQLGQDPPPTVTGELQGDLLNFVPQIDVAVWGRRLMAAVEASSADVGCLAHV
jgi:hypothetical protein